MNKNMMNNEPNNLYIFFMLIVYLKFNNLDFELN
jgi:hypothetical protein